MLISSDSRRIEPAATDPHYHVWRDHGLAQTIMTPRFGTNQAARQAALRAGMEKGAFVVRKCTLPCRCLVKRKRRPRRKCRHCGRRP